jgi:hypothetical protein
MAERRPAGRPQLAIAAVLCVLNHHVDPGQIAKVKGTLPKQLRQMWDKAETIAFPERGPELRPEAQVTFEAV